MNITTKNAVLKEWNLPTDFKQYNLKTNLDHKGARGYKYPRGYTESHERKQNKMKGWWNKIKETSSQEEKEEEEEMWGQKETRNKK